MMVRGYASVFNEVDNHGDVMLHGAFASALKTLAGSHVEMRLSHGSGKCGVWFCLEEDAIGLKAHGIIFEELPEGARAIQMIRAGRLNGLSICGVGTEYRSITRCGKVIREVCKLNRLDEISLCEHPSCGSAGLGFEESGTMACIAKLNALIEEIKYENAH